MNLGKLKDVLVITLNVIAVIIIFTSIITLFALISIYILEYRKIFLLDLLWFFDLVSHSLTTHLPILLNVVVT